MKILEKTDCLASLCDLFGMGKWPFSMVKWPPTRGWKGHFESPGGRPLRIRFSTLCFIQSIGAAGHTTATSTWSSASAWEHCFWPSKNVEVGMVQLGCLMVEMNRIELSLFDFCHGETNGFQVPPRLPGSRIIKVFFNLLANNFWEGMICSSTNDSPEKIYRQNSAKHSQKTCHSKAPYWWWKKSCTSW